MRPQLEGTKNFRAGVGEEGKGRTERSMRELEPTIEHQFSSGSFFLLSLIHDPIAPFCSDYISPTIELISDTWSADSSSWLPLPPHNPPKGQVQAQ